MGAPRIGVFGGTFDPPHIGHLVAAVNVAHHLDLTMVLFVVAEIPWQKAGQRQISSSTDRFAMTEQAVADRPEFVASPVEIHAGGESVTADTLETLSSLHPAAELTVIVGSDAAAGLHTWRRPHDLARMAHFAVVDRPGSSGGRPTEGFRYEVIDCPLMDVSSTDIRSRARLGLPLDYLVPDTVRAYISARQLYR